MATDSADRQNSQQHMKNTLIFRTLLIALFLAVSVLAIAFGEGDTALTRAEVEEGESGTAERMAAGAAVLGQVAFLTALGQQTDGVKPVLSVADPPLANGLTLTLTYDEPLDTTSEPAPSDFEILVNSGVRPVAAVVVSGSAVTLTLESSLAIGQTVTVTYTPGSNAIRDEALNDADVLTNQSVTNETRPNILLITADDLNWDSVGAYGSPVTGSTPNIDQLATEGIRFDHAHVTIAVCAPNRSVLMTGRYPHLSGGEGFHRLTLDGVPILPALLRSEGYAVGILGKVGHSTPYEDFSWDTAQGKQQLGFSRNPEAFYQHAQTFVEGASDSSRPFFLMANSNDPHRPFYGNDPDSYYEADIPALAPSHTFTSDDVVVPGFLPDLTDVRTEVAEYYSSVRRLDDTVGRLLDVLDDTGVAENTIVMFLSDNGMPFPFAKANVYFNSTRTPWIMRWPGVIQAGTVNTDHFISSIDLLPTILDVVGADIPAGVNGTTFLPLLRGTQQEGREQVFTQFYETSSQRAFPMRSVQNAQFGYIFNPWSDGTKKYRSHSQIGRTWKSMQEAAYNDPELAARTRLYSYRVPEELYDYESDPDALENLIDASDYADDLDALRTDLLEWMVETNDPLLSDFRVFIAGLMTTHDICDRTQEVEAGILSAVTATDCAFVPERQLAAITSLDLSEQSISSLQANDFDGLASLTELLLDDNSMTTLPAGLFYPLSALTTLDLRDNSGLSYSPYLLNPLTSLTTLDGAAFTRPSAPGAPAGLTASFQAGNIELSWTAPGTGAATSYQILRKAGSDDEEVYVADSYDPDADAPSTAYTDAGVTEGETYEYRVRALNAGGASLESGAATVSIIPPGVPDRPEGTAVFVGGVDLEWNGVPGAEYYDVQLGRGGQWIDLPADGVEIAFYGAGAIISGLDPEATLWFRVRAANGQGISDWSETLQMSSTSQFKLGRKARPANEPATGAPVIHGTAQVGETLTADTTGIEDGNGLDRVQFQYQWTSNDGRADTDIAGATDSGYTMAADDVGRTIRVRVTFTDRGGYSETLTSVATGAVAGTANNPATWTEPAISGTVQVGETLTADTSGIADADGLESVSYTYQWVANDGTSDTDILDATGYTYTLLAADAGQTIKVEVSFTDDAGNDETLSSGATDAVAAPEPPAKPTGLSAAAVSHDAVTLTWDNPQDDAITGYVILRRDREIHPGGTFVTIAGDTGSADTTYTDDTVEPDKQYVYRIKAINEHGEVSQISNWVRGFTPAVPIPDKPTGLSAAVVSRDAVTLTWDNPQDDSITGYVILRRDRAIHPGGTFVTIAGDTGSTDTTYTDDTVEPDKQYVYRIKAINEHGEVSQISNWVRGFTPAVPVPDKPTGLSPVVSHDAVILAWDDPQDDSVTGYVILRRDRAIHLVGTFVTIAGDTGSTDTTYTDETVEPDKEYVYRIKAINEHGEVSEMSDWVRGFTPAAPAPAG